MEILIVDDDLGTRDTLALGLRAMGGHNVATAPSTSAALVLARSRTFDVALIDQRLGEESGLDLLHELRSTRSGQAAMYILTAWGTISDAVEAMRRGAVDYLEKGHVDLEQLIAMLGTAQGPKVAKDPRIRVVLTMIAANPAASADQLASAVELSVSRLRALFKSETGVALKKYQRAACLDRAAFLVRNTGRRISDIAFALGFQDLQWFERLFRRQFAESPSGYRHRSKCRQLEQK